MKKFGKGFLKFAGEFKFTLWSKILIWFTFYNHKYSEFADRIIRKIIANGEIVPENSDRYYLCVRIGDAEYYVWVENRWYASLSWVRKDYMLGDAIYDRARPSRRTIIAFFDWLNAYIKENRQEILDETAKNIGEIMRDFK